MARSLTAGMITEITATSINLAFLIKMEFDSGDETLWTGLGDLSFGGDTYVGAGQLLAISGMRETASDVATGVGVSLAGEINSLIAIALAEKYMGRPLTIWMAAFDASDAIIADPTIVFKGKMDTMGISTNGTRTQISLQAESDLIKLQRPNAGRYNDEDQQRLFSGDLGFEFLPFLADAQIPWGVPAEVVQPPAAPVQPSARSEMSDPPLPVTGDDDALLGFDDDDQ